MVWGNRVFAGEVPRVPARQLPDQAAQVAVNCWLDESQPRPIPEPTLVEGVGEFNTNVKTIFRFDAARWFQWNTDVDAARAPVVEDTTFRTVWTGQDFPRFTSTQIMHGGGFVSPGLPISRRLGIPVPDNAPVAVLDALDDEDADAVAESHAWVYTFVSDLLEEGPPSTPSAVLTRGFNNDGSIQPVTLTMDTAVTGPYSIQSKRIYRTATGASGVTTYLLVASVPFAQASYTDSVLTANLGAALISTNWDPPAEDLKGLKSLPNGVLVAFRGREIHFSEPYQPHAWPSDYVQVVDDEVVGLDNFGTTVVVGTEGDPAVLSGSHPSQMTPAKLEYNQSCVSKNSFAYADLQGVIYASPDGLVLVGPQGGQLITEPVYTRKQWAALAPAGMVRAVYHDRAYLAFFADQSVAFDPKMQGIVRTDDAAKVVYHDRARDSVYIIDATNRLKEWKTAPAVGDTIRAMRWRSKLHVGSRRTYFAAQVIAENYPVTFRLFADGQRVEFILVIDERPFRLDADMGLHAKWFYEIEGQNTVEEVRIGSMMEMQ